MKRRDLIKKLEENGWVFIREGGRHDIYSNGKRSEPIARHKEIPDLLAQKILKRNNIY